MQGKTELVAYLDGFLTQRRRDLFDRVLSDRTRHIKVALEGFADPNDACAVMRSCEIFGVQDLHILSKDQRFKLSAGVVVGSSKWVTLHRPAMVGNKPATTTQALAPLRASGYRIVAVSTRAGAIPIEELPLEAPMVLCFGADETGLSQELYDIADHQTYIPAAGFTRRFNISVCAALCLASLRERLNASAIDWRLEEPARLDLRLEWQAKMLKRVGNLVERFFTDRGMDPAHYGELGLPPTFVRLAGLGSKG